MKKSILTWLSLVSLTLSVAGCNSSTESSKAPEPDNSSFTMVETKASQDQIGAIKLSPDMVYGGSTKTVKAKVLTGTEETPNGLKFWMTRSDPAEGEFAAITFKIDALETGMGYTLKMDLTNPYMRAGYQDRIVYQVMMGDDLLLTEDVAENDKVNNIQISWKADKPEASFTVRSLAIANCGASKWGKYATPIILENVSYEPASEVKALSVKASSPFTTIEK